MSMEAESKDHKLKSNPRRTTLSDSHTPMSMALEDHYYLSEADFCDAVAKAFYSKYFV